MHPVPITNQNLPMDQITEICRANGVSRLFLFGSALTDRFRIDSDLDLLVEFELGRLPGFRLYEIEEQLSTVLGRTVDLHTYHSLSQYFRADLHKVLIYDASRPNPVTANSRRLPEDRDVLDGTIPV